MTDAFEDIYRSLVEQHSAAGELAPVHKAIIRQMAVLLSADSIDAADARSIVQLEAMLPSSADVEEAAPAWDLSKLSDQELSLLKSLGDKCATTEPQPTFGDKLVESYAQHEKTIKELTAERDRRWAAEQGQHDLRSKLARAEVEVTRLQAALSEAAGALEKVKATLPAPGAENAATASAQASSGNVILLRPSEAPDCQPCFAPAERFSPDLGA
jgi:hypothetical protein